MRALAPSTMAGWAVPWAQPWPCPHPLCQVHHYIIITFRQTHKRPILLFSSLPSPPPEQWHQSTKLGTRDQRAAALGVLLKALQVLPVSRPGPSLGKCILEDRAADCSLAPHTHWPLSHPHHSNHAAAPTAPPCAVQSVGCSTVVSFRISRS